MEVRDIPSAMLDRLAPKGPPSGFSKGIYDALISASSLAHLKAAAVLGFAMTLLGLLASNRPTGDVQLAIFSIGIVLLVAAAGCAGMVIFPKQAVRHGGQIFWGDIVTHGSAAKYVESLQTLSASSAESEYAATNYYFSSVLASKFVLVRWAVALLMLGAFFAVSARLLS